MDQPFSQNPVQLLENSKWKLKLDKSESMYQFQCHWQCSLSLVERSLSGVTYTFMERILFTFTLNKRQFQADSN